MTDDDAKTLARVKFALQLGAGVHLNEDQARVLAEYVGELQAVVAAARVFVRTSGDLELPHAAYEALVALQTALAALDASEGEGV